MKNKILVAIILLLCVFFVIRFFRSENIDKELKNFNMNLPVRYDEFSQLDSVTMPNPKELNYHITVYIEKEKADTDSINKYITPNLLNNIRINPSLKRYRDKEFTWNYLFNDTKGDIFYSYKITPEMYQ